MTSEQPERGHSMFTYERGCFCEDCGAVLTDEELNKRAAKETPRGGLSAGEIVLLLWMAGPCMPKPTEEPSE
jgi:hypothetical protein